MSERRFGSFGWVWLGLVAGFSPVIAQASGSCAALFSVGRSGSGTPGYRWFQVESAGPRMSIEVEGQGPHAWGGEQYLASTGDILVRNALGDGGPARIPLKIGDQVKFDSGLPRKGWVRAMAYQPGSRVGSSRSYQPEVILLIATSDPENSRVSGVMNRNDGTSLWRDGGIRAVELQKGTSVLARAGAQTVRVGDHALTVGDWVRVKEGSETYAGYVTAAGKVKKGERSAEGVEVFSTIITEGVGFSHLTRRFAASDLEVLERTPEASGARLVIDDQRTLPVTPEEMPGMVRMIPGVDAIRIRVTHPFEVLEGDVSLWEWGKDGVRFQRRGNTLVSTGMIGIPLFDRDTRRFDYDKIQSVEIGDCVVLKEGNSEVYVVKLIRFENQGTEGRPQLTLRVERLDKGEARTGEEHRLIDLGTDQVAWVSSVANVPLEVSFGSKQIRRGDRVHLKEPPPTVGNGPGIYLVTDFFRRRGVDMVEIAVLERDGYSTEAFHEVPLSGIQNLVTAKGGGPSLVLDLDWRWGETAPLRKDSE